MSPVTPIDTWGTSGGYCTLVSQQEQKEEPAHEGIGESRRRLFVVHRFLRNPPDSGTTKTIKNIAVLISIIMKTSGDTAILWK